jgi:hypothetical protein
VNCYIINGNVHIIIVVLTLCVCVCVMVGFYVVYLNMIILNTRFTVKLHVMYVVG